MHQAEVDQADRHGRALGHRCHPQKADSPLKLQFYMLKYGRTLLKICEVSVELLSERKLEMSYQAEQKGITTLRLCYVHTS